MSKKHWRYMELEKILHLPNSGRCLLGKYIYWTEKRDGSCLAIWLELLPKWKRILNKIESFVTRWRPINIPDPLKYKVVVSSRNMKEAEHSIRKDFHTCEDSVPVLRYLNDNPTHIVFGEILRKGLSPTRIENHEKVEFVVFDIVSNVVWDGDPSIKLSNEHQFLGYQQIHQFCYHYKAKCVRLFGEGRFTSMKSLMDYRDEMLKLCKEEKREGVVLKTFDESGKPLYAKEKLDTATPRGHPKIEKGTPEYPPLPFSEAMGAVDKAYVDLGEKFGDKKVAMPVVARYIKEEMKKHMCTAPEINFFNLYLQYCSDHNIDAYVIGEAAETKKESLLSKIRRMLRL